MGDYYVILYFTNSIIIYKTYALVVWLVEQLICRKKIKKTKEESIKYYFRNKKIFKN